MQPALSRPVVKVGSLAVIFLVAVATKLAHSTEYHCPAVKKYDFGFEYKPDYIEKAQFSTRLEELPEGAFLSRCSFSPIAERMTCDRYKVDRVEFDRRVGIKKFYVFRSQFDFQLFPNLSSLENNGRGGVQYGKCKLAKP
jgi:hypothetical protein